MCLKCLTRRAVRTFSQCQTQITSIKKQRSQSNFIILSSSCKLSAYKISKILKINNYVTNKSINTDIVSFEKWIIKIEKIPNINGTIDKMLFLVFEAVKQPLMLILLVWMLLTFQCTFIIFHGFTYLKI